jgi:hypothetical protein
MGMEKKEALVKTEVYDTVRVETLEVGDHVQIAGLDFLVKGVTDVGSHILLDLYDLDNEMLDEGQSFWATSMVDLVRYV